MKQYTFVLNFGYVESSRLAFLPFSSNKKFKNEEEALKDLSLFLKGKYEEYNVRAANKCCMKSKEKNPEDGFCSKCGNSLKRIEFDKESFESWLKELDGYNVDEFASIIDYNDYNEWESDGLEGKPNQIFVYNAEWVILAALGFPHHKSHTFENICKNRTESMVNSFLY